MDWLSTYRAHVDCHQKRIIFKLKEIPEYVYEGMKNKINIPIILTLKATKLLRHMCQGFLATIIDKEGEKTKIKNIAVKENILMCPQKNYQVYPQIRK